PAAAFFFYDSASKDFYSNVIRVYVLDATQILVKVGDKVEAEQSLITVEGDKASRSEETTADLQWHVIIA
ncbi:hypothetical protein CYD78_30460, partial [Klebsiella pneumoniae]